MAADTESAMTETKKVINPRVEIDTSPPFESVKEAVDRFGGGGPWIPQHLLPLATHQNGTEHLVDMDKVEEQAAQLEKDLMMKEQETLNVLKELEAAKRFVEGIKLNFIQEVSALMGSPDLKPQGQNSTEQNLSMCPAVSPGLISMELNQAKMSLNQTTTNLAVIRASVESLNHKMRVETPSVEKGNGVNVNNSAKLMPANEDFAKCRALPDEDHQNFRIVKNSDRSMDILKDVKEVNFEAEQFKKMTEASRYEVMKAMSEIERTKNSIKMAEMRLTAARKMEEAAKAVEAIALAERSAMLEFNNAPDAVFFNKSGGITLSIEEYNSLTHKAQQAEELCKTKFIDSNAYCRIDETNQPEVTIVKKLESTTKETRRSKKSLEEAMVNEDDYDRRYGFNQNCVGQNADEDDQMGYYTGNNSAKFRFRNSHSSATHRGSEPIDENDPDEAKDKVYRSTISIGDILSRKLILQDDIVVGKHVDSHGERREVSLSQMLREQSGHILHPTRSAKETNLDKQFYTQRKKFGFIHVTIPRHSKKKAQFL
ncbi:OLC1v1021928C1 [Oldenlandia corymbosa var. corymbosa]|uniref:OLC1v1021928C1 n=1 Tax=Oldenlandia corymbosa var. corymbosa TaxID=529605 RepID=A0AAV1C8Q8_OLDCO|nr:OLC1v1021928C1 [Oldenlandia corymbosa var. corymbosa]